MPDSSDPDLAERKVLGAALRELRDLSGLSQDAAAEAYAALARPGQKDEFTGQAFGAYETGERKAITQPSRQARLAQSVGATREELLMRAARLRGDRPPARDLNDRGHNPFADFPSGQTQRMRMPDDSLRPWATSATMIVYDLDQWPRHDEGCVLEPLDGGAKLVRIFLRADADVFHVAQLSPDRVESTIPRADFNAYRVVARIG